ncbi:MAG: TonB-dependent receptor domain-containing protein [Bryobacteraceae bacterium]
MLVRFVLMIVLMISCALAQETRGTILGRVTDPTGAVIGGADVRATNVATGVTVAAKTNEAGNYTLPYLLTGAYTVEAELSGFKRFVREGIQVRVNDVVQLNIDLQVGNVTEAIEVTAETPLLSTSESSLGQVVDERRVTELPTYGNSPMALAQLAPGVINTKDTRLAKAGSFSISKNSEIATDGAGAYNNEFTLDGVSNTQGQGTSARVGFIPPQSAVAEFKVQTSSFDASVGHTIGALVNVSTKGGTNTLHGEAYWWLRNSAFDTANIFQNRAGQKLPVYQDNRYGVAGSGPVVLPKLYNGKNKTFWFYMWEGNKFGNPKSFTNTVPTEAMRRGDLSGLLALGANYQVYDPLTTTAEAGGRFRRQPFAGNIIPASRLDPVAQKILPYWNLPNQAGTKEGRSNHFLAGKGLEDTWVHLGRLDHAFNQNHRIFLRLNKDFWEEDKNRYFTTGASGIIINRYNNGVSFDDVYVFTPSFLMNVRWGITRATFTERRASRGFDLASLGFSQRLTGLIDPSLMAFPNVQVGSLTALSDWDSGDGGNYSTTHSLAATLTKLRGSHNMRFGFDFRVYRENVGRYPLDVAPRLIFSSTYTRGPLDTNAAPAVGGELAAFLLGIPEGEMARTGTSADQDKYLGLFWQDDYKLSRKLTVNFGLRYEYESPVTERYNRSVAGFAFGQASPIEAQARANYAKSPIPELPVDQFRVQGGLTFVGVGGNPRGFWKGEKNNFMPRIGLAYQLAPTTVLRAGYGLFFDSLGAFKTDAIQTGFSMSTPIQPSMDSGLTYIVKTADPFPNGLLPPLGAAGGLSTNLGQSVSFFQQVRKQPYVQRWTFGLQHTLPGQFLAEAAYVGSRGTRLSITRQLNNTPEQYLSRLTVRDQKTIDFLGAQFASPLSGTNPIYAKNMSRANLLKPYPQFGSVSTTEPMGYSWYHSLQARVERRFTRGFTYQLSYTWSKTMQATEFLNPTDPKPYRTLSDMDRPHRLVMSGIWELPFGRGRRMGNSWPVVLDFFAGGWQLNGIVQRQTGMPLAFGDVWTLFTGNPDNIALPDDKRTVDRWFNTDAGFNRNSGQQLASNIRVSTLRVSSVRAPSQDRWELSVIKTFRVTERVKTQFRAECLNALNHPNLSAPNTTPTSSAFGTITGQDPTRSWQFSLRTSF